MFRLHLIVHGEQGRAILQCTKLMIIIDYVMIKGTATVVIFGSSGNSGATFRNLRTS